jgi:signal transduction histidine kinase
MMAKRSLGEQVGSGATLSAVNPRQEDIFASAEIPRKLLSLVPMPLLIINGDWQVVYANAAVLKMLATADHAPVHGLREGEAFHCIHGRTDGVGESSSPMCRVCGVAKAVAAALDGQGTVSDFRISCDLAGETHSLDLRAWAMPLAVGGNTLSFLALADITHEKRRAMLENVCFHDLLNTLTGIRGLLDVLSYTDVAELPEVCRSLDQMTTHSIEEIGSLSSLVQAEGSTLQVVWGELQSGEFLHGTMQTLRSHPAVRGKQVLIDGDAANVTFSSDRRLLRRVVDNLLLNALEATPEGGTVTMGCTLTANQVDIWVHNDTWMPPEVQLQVFQGTFSTKGHGRGFGTYGIRLLITSLLGAVNFSSTPENGTTFHVTLPQQPVL